MKILVVGEGAREHAIAYSLSKNKKVEKIFSIGTNPYNLLLEKCERILIKTKDEILNFAKENKIDLTIIGNEEFLVKGIVDDFKKNNLKIFGPNKKAAMLEGSKAFSKEFMKKYGVKTASYEIFNDINLAIEYIKTQKFPKVIKASGLAAGKGVIIANDLEESIKAINDIMKDKVFNDAGNTIVIEDFLEGVEVSILSITDSIDIIPLKSAKDHKKIFDGEKGLNTGGMGVISPNPYYSKEIEEKFIENILNPTLRGIKEEKMNFSGIIFFGLMISKGEVYLLEYNMRFGDPETQSVLSLLESDFLELIEKSINKDLKNINIKWKDKYALTLVAASNGYPLSYEKGYEIKGIEKLSNLDNIKVFLAGVKEENNKFYTNGGRVLNVVAIENTLEEARNLAYEKMKEINFKNKYIRGDIGKID